MLSYGYDPENPALDERLEAKPVDEDREYLELWYTYQALLDEVRRLDEANKAPFTWALGTIGRKNFPPVGPPLTMVTL